MFSLNLIKHTNLQKVAKVFTFKKLLASPTQPYPSVLGETVRTRFQPQNMRPPRDYVVSPGPASAVTQKAQNPGFLRDIRLTSFIQICH